MLPKLVRVARTVSPAPIEDFLNWLGRLLSRKPKLKLLEMVSWADTTHCWDCDRPIAFKDRKAASESYDMCYSCWCEGIE